MCLHMTCIARILNLIVPLFLSPYLGQKLRIVCVQCALTSFKYKLDQDVESIIYILAKKFISKFFVFVLFHAFFLH